MKKLRLTILAIVATIFASSASAFDPAQFLTFQKADEGVLNYLMAIKGVCSKLLVNGEVFPCKNSLIHTEYQDGRIGFYFLEEGGSGKVLTFSGSGLKQKKLSENVRIQPVDGVIQKDGILNVSGECYFENPYVGEANIKCVATDASGIPFEGHFLTDGSEPEIKDFTEFSNETLQKDTETKIDTTMGLYLEYFWAIAVITSPILQNGNYDYRFDQKTYKSRMNCEFQLHKYMKENETIDDNQLVRCEKVDEIIGILID